MTQLGLSLRNAWIPAWNDLALGRFDLYEIVPFTDNGREENALAQVQLDACDGKPAWMHVTTASLCDSPDFFTSRMDQVEASTKDPRITGVSLHYAVQHLHGHYLPQPFPALDLQQARDYARENFASLRSRFPDKRIGIENVSCGLKALDGGGHLDQFRLFLQESGAELLLDLTNLWNTARNLGAPFETLLAPFRSLPLCYLHVGGSFLRSGTALDAHQEYKIAPEVLDAARRLGTVPLVYEHDYAPQNLKLVKSHLDAFHAAHSA